MSAYLSELFGLAGRTAVVTGGSSGIGRAMAGALGRAGARVVLVARRPDPLADTIRAMAARGWGRIINVVSQQAFRAYGNSGAYGVAKAGLVALTRSQAEAWSARGVCCNAVAPGVVRTPLTEEVFAD